MVDFRKYSHIKLCFLKKSLNIMDANINGFTVYNYILKSMKTSNEDT